MGWPRPRRLLDLRPRLGLRAALLIIALVAVVMGTERFRRENRDMDRSWVTRQLRNLKQGEPRVRRSAVEELAALGTEDLGRVSTALIDVLGDPDPEVRRAAARGWARMAGGGDPNGEIPAAMLGAIGPLTAATADEDPGVRAASVEALGQFGWLARRKPPGERARSSLLEASVDPLLRSLDDPEPEVRRKAATAVPLVLSPLGDAPVRLIEMAGDEDPGVRSDVYRALGSGWPNHWAIESALLPAVLRGGLESYQAASAMSYHGPPSDEAMDAMLRLLESSKEAGPWQREAVIGFLTQYGRGARPALPALLAIAKQEEGGSLDFGVARAMVHIDPNMPETRELLRLVAERGVRPVSDVEPEWAGFLLKQSGQAGQDLVPWIRRQTEDPDPGVRDRAFVLLERMGEIPAAQRVAAQGGGAR